MLNASFERVSFPFLLSMKRKKVGVLDLSRFTIVWTIPAMPHHFLLKQPFLQLLPKYCIIAAHARSCGWNIGALRCSCDNTKLLTWEKEGINIKPRRSCSPSALHSVGAHIRITKEPCLNAPWWHHVTLLQLLPRHIRFNVIGNLKRMTLLPTILSEST